MNRPKEKKITLSTLKSFINKNKGALYIRQKSSFDGMVDGVVDCEKLFSKAIEDNSYGKYNLGYKGIWIVGSSGNYFNKYEENGFIGIEVSNCCDSSIVAIKSEN